MTSDEFNDKWIDHLETGHYGMDIELPAVIDYMDDEFTKEAVTNPTFTYSQIKMKFGTSRVYTTSSKHDECERGIDNIYKQREA